MLFSTLVVETGLKACGWCDVTISLCRQLTQHLSVINRFKGPFSLRAWKRAFFVSFIDLRLKREVKIEASAKKVNKTNKEFSFWTLVVETGLNGKGRRKSLFAN